MSVSVLPHEGMNCPVFLCDYCGRQIVGAGVACWEPGTTGPVKTVHKGACDKAAGLPFWMELEDFTVSLAHNLTEPVQ